ncbi:4a-hydroxytetrahydrobiopterin dehydratase [Streptosporangium roseum]|uniref:Putative pterin-4-alpha-carbinolamine dehydratase n=1 Tax=Streptosporangium roseum (strain ATCC 12428 / DSM 43021 / JCM 3005 / KCTC 9067 / NCIMB 10171 / NRRL 2505 / NI 9100) TaxID=479432 RepID=D2BAY1_STRRD|nr:4a-hydroxytetrahydrobiopterin dehydratase [Streptosporangium roseum]ACZ91745.1 putative pterin-4-alpha-carbinolamine dehydratase [Streptosporangium roseum DSM 43021]
MLPQPLSEKEIAAHLAGLPGWEREDHAIARTFTHTYHECVHMAMYVAAKAREVGHHPDVHITWQRIRFVITTHDAGNRLTVKDFELAHHIDAIAAGHGAESPASSARPNRRL